MISRTFVILSIFTVTLLSAALSMAASVTVIPSGSNSYIVQGADMDGVAGIDLSISYDSSSLASPSVNQGALVNGSMFIANANNPGSIKVAIITTSPFKGSGQIATITFGSQTGSGGVTGVTASLINIKGAPVAVQSSVVAGNSSITAPQTPAGSPTNTTVPSASSSSTTSTTAATGISSSLGTVNMPADMQPSSAAVPAATVPIQPEPTASKAAKQEEVPNAVAEHVEEAAPLQAVYSGIAERFRNYNGAKTPAAMVELFNQPVAKSIRQEPAIVVSDGSSKFKLIVELPAGSSTSPNFALRGAKMISLKTADEPGKWVVEALPNRNISNAAVTVIQGSSVQEYHVTVVPPITAISGNDQDFTAFLKDSGAKAPKFDLNGDGKHDYLDDFIYTGHYLLKNKK